MPSIDEDQENDGDGDHNYDTAPFGMEVDEDGTRHYTTADRKKNLFFKKMHLRMVSNCIEIQLQFH